MGLKALPVSLGTMEGETIEIVSVGPPMGQYNSRIAELKNGRRVYIPTHVEFDDHPAGRYVVVGFATEYDNRGFALRDPDDYPAGWSAASIKTDAKKG